MKQIVSTPEEGNVVRWRFLRNILITTTNIYWWLNWTMSAICPIFSRPSTSKILEEDGVLTDCSIKTMEPEEVLDFDFCTENVVNKIIMKSECLREAFSELDMTSSVLEFLLSPDPPYFRMSTFGNAGRTHSDFPRDSDMIESFQCQATQTNRYKISLLKPSVKALTISSRVSIRVDKRGFLSLQFMIKNEDGQVCFVEFYCVPDEDEEPEE
ncbi:cycle checkpoint RAD1-like [Octopus vulgaris]|uniref:Cycle checkpoint RAD1-like n=1 Tax=Octopus vulgaris TaxID=6645 RepID=A0AA36B011_OCTVU|nr:cycle checkpoint RAD1-like [Octopus vulgaris]